MWNSFQWNKNVMLSCLVPFIFISPLTSFRFKCIWHKLFSSCPVKSRHKSTPNSYLFFPSPLPPLPFIPCYTFAPASISQSENQTLETRKGQECRDGAPLANCRLGVNVSLSPSCAHALSASSHFVSFLLLIDLYIGCLRGSWTRRCVGMKRIALYKTIPKELTENC